MRIFALLLLSILTITTVTLPAEEAPPIKYGTLSQDEIWTTDIYLVGDLTIPQGISVTVNEGITIFFSNYDLLRMGEDPGQCEIHVDGTLHMTASELQPIRFESIEDTSMHQILTQKDNIQTIAFEPYHIDTKIMRDEFKSFKHEYFVLWGIIYAFWILR